MSKGGIYRGPGGVELHGDGTPVYSSPALQRPQPQPPLHDEWWEREGREMAATVVMGHGPVIEGIRRITSAAWAAADALRPAPAAPSDKSSCPCVWTTPCQPNCSCVTRGSSHGCTRCCRYGSLEQRRAMAEVIVARERAPAAPAATASAETYERMRRALVLVKNVLEQSGLDDFDYTLAAVRDALASADAAAAPPATPAQAAHATDVKLIDGKFNVTGEAAVASGPALTALAHVKRLVDVLQRFVWLAQEVKPKNTAEFMEYVAERCRSVQEIIDAYSDTVLKDADDAPAPRGDWLCPCGYMMSAGRSSCRKCGAPRPQQAPAPAALTAAATGSGHGAAYEEGYLRGLREFAHWKDGVQYVGTCGTTLADAIADFKRERGYPSAAPAGDAATGAGGEVSCS